MEYCISSVFLKYLKGNCWPVQNIANNISVGCVIAGVSSIRPRCLFAVKSSVITLWCFIDALNVPLFIELTILSIVSYLCNVNTASSLNKNISLIIGHC